VTSVKKCPAINLGSQVKSLIVVVKIDKLVKRMMTTQHKLC